MFLPFYMFEIRLLGKYTLKQKGIIGCDFNEKLDVFILTLPAAKGGL